MNKHVSMVQRTLALSAMATAAAALVAACGGSSNDGDDTASLTLSGTAATGAALGGASVTAKCATGTQTGQTLEDGTYSLRVAGGALPCVLQATSASGDTTLYSMAQGSGDQAVANITPITHLVLAKAMGDEAAVKAAFDANPTATQLSAATAKLTDALSVVRVALSGVADYSENPFTTPFTATHGSVKGDVLDQKLDALQTKLGEAQSDLSQLTHAIATSQSEDADKASPAVAGVLTPPASTACPNVRSGAFIVASQRGDLSTDGPGVYDAAKKTWTEPDGSTVRSTGLDVDTCQMIVYQPDSAKEAVRVVFNARGLGIWKDVSGNGSDFGLIFPHQLNSLADLAGDWNLVAFNREDTASTGAFGVGRGTVSANGAWATSMCSTTAGSATCGDWENETSFSVNNGKFSNTDGHGYLFKAANGTKLYVHSFGDEYGLAVGTQPWTMPLPAVGDSVKFWGVSGSFSSSQAMSSGSYTVDAVDAAASSYTRSDAEVRVMNKPLDGMSYRAATANQGSVIYLHAKGLLTVFGREKRDANTFVGFSISQ